MRLTLTFGEVEQIILDSLRPKLNLPLNATITIDGKDKDVTISWINHTDESAKYPINKPRDMGIRPDTLFGATGSYNISTNNTSLGANGPGGLSTSYPGSTSYNWD